MADGWGQYEDIEAENERAALALAAASRAGGGQAVEDAKQGSRADRNESQDAQSNRKNTALVVDREGKSKQQVTSSQKRDISNGAGEPGQIGGAASVAAGSSKVQAETGVPVLAERSSVPVPSTAPAKIACAVPNGLNSEPVAGKPIKDSLKGSELVEQLDPSLLDLDGSGGAELRSLLREKEAGKARPQTRQILSSNSRSSSSTSTSTSTTDKVSSGDDIFRQPSGHSDVSQVSAPIKHSNRFISPQSSSATANSPDMGNSPSCPNFGSLEAAHQRIFNSGLTFSEAKGQIWELRKSGSLMKRGFRYRKLWVKRHVELSGRLLKYYEKKPKDIKAAANPRGSLELTQYTAVVALPNSASLRFAFNIIPDGNHPKYASHEQSIVGSPPLNRQRGQQERATTVIGGRVFREPAGASQTVSNARTSRSGSHGGGGGGVFSSWFGWGASDKNDAPQVDEFGNPVPQSSDDSKVWRLMARSEKERRAWIHMLEKAVNLIRRVEVAPTLCGIGSVHYHYRLDEKIGTGWFGDVYSAVATMTGKRYAIKAVDKAKRVKTKEDASVLRTEIKVMRRITRELDHANICKLFQAYEDTSMVYLVMEHLSGGNLLEHIAECATDYSEAFVADIVRQVAGALKELHGAGIVLCDLKPENLLYTDPTSNVVKVVEFGRAIICHSSAGASGLHNNNSKAGGVGPATFTPGASGLAKSSNGVSRRGPLVGTPGFIAPEVISFRDYSPACDIWALGCILFTLLVGYPPFSGGTAPEVLQATAQGLQADKLSKEDWKNVSGKARLIIGGMLRTNQSRRLNAHAILADEWINSPPEESKLEKPLERIRRQHAKRNSNFGNQLRNAAASATVSGSSLALRNASTPPDSFRATAGAVNGASNEKRAATVTKAQVDSETTGRLSRNSSGMRLSANWSTPDFLAENNGNIGFPTRAAAFANGDDWQQQQQQQAPAGGAQQDHNGSGTSKLRPSVSTFFELLNESNAEPNSANGDRRAELLALDVRAEKIRAQFGSDANDEWGLPVSPHGYSNGVEEEDSQANFAPAGRFLNDLESQMRKVREEEQRRLEFAANGDTSHAITEQQAAQVFQPPLTLSPTIHVIPPTTVSTAASTPVSAVSTSASSSANRANTSRSANHNPHRAGANRRSASEDLVNDDVDTDAEEEDDEEEEEEEEKSGSFLGSLSRSLGQSGSMIARTADPCARDNIESR